MIGVAEIIQLVINISIIVLVIREYRKARTEKEIQQKKFNNLMVKTHELENQVKELENQIMKGNDKQ